jgi:hypothetical protein
MLQVGIVHMGRLQDRDLLWRELNGGEDEDRAAEYAGDCAQWIERLGEIQAAARALGRAQLRDKGLEAVSRKERPLAHPWMVRCAPGFGYFARSIFMLETLSQSESMGGQEFDKNLQCESQFSM